MLKLSLLFLFLCQILIAGSIRAERTDSELRYLLKHDCGSCHGMSLRGGLGPALTRDVMLGRDKNEIQGVILNGRPGTAMPPWRSLVTENEASRLAAILIKGENK